MTSMSITLSLIDLLSEISETPLECFELKHQMVILNALQGAYWHARSFNDDDSLRRDLAARAFMPFNETPTLLPHLLEQEAVSLTKIVHIAMRLYLHSGDPKSVEPWIRR